MSAFTTGEEDLRQLVQQIVAAEESFTSRSQQMRGDDLELEERHRKVVERLGREGAHCQLRAAHEAMFKVHRKIAQEHQNLIQHCLTVSRRFRMSMYTEPELIAELARLRLVYQRIQNDHDHIEEERKRILTEHEKVASHWEVD
jgi:hypothetical protein